MTTRICRTAGAPARPWAARVVAVAAVGATAIAVAGPGSAPLNMNLGDIGPLMTDGDARILVLHDSQWNVTTSYRLHQGAMYEWRPWRWSGRVLAGGDDNAATGVADLNTAAPNVLFESINPPEPYASDPDAPTGHSLLNAGEWRFAGPTIQSPGLGQWWLGDNHYGQGDAAAADLSKQWPQQEDVTFRLLYRRTDTTVSSLRLRSQRGTVAGADQVVPLSAANGHHFLEVACPLSLAPLNQPKLVLFGQNNEEAGQSLVVTGVIGYVPDPEGPQGRRTGLLFNQCGFAGMKVKDHLNKELFSDAAREAMIRDGFEPNVLAIMLGHNDSPADVLDGQYELDLEQLIEDWFARYDAVGAARPYIVLIAAWTTDAPTASFAKMSAVRDEMRNLATEHGYGYISLFDYYDGLSPSVSAGLHMDAPYRVHPGDLPAARHLARAIWEQFEHPDLPTDCEAITCPCEMTCDPGANVDVFDLLAFLDMWFADDPRANLGGGDPGTVDVFDLLEFLDCWFEASWSGACV